MTETPLPKPSKSSKGNLVAAIVLGILSVPAAGIAFFCTCLATLKADGNTGLIVSSVAAGLVILLMGFLAFRIGRG